MIPICHFGLSSFEITTRLKLKPNLLFSLAILLSTYLKLLTTKYIAVKLVQWAVLDGQYQGFIVKMYKVHPNQSAPFWHPLVCLLSTLAWYLEHLLAGQQSIVASLPLFFGYI